MSWPKPCRTCTVPIVPRSWRESPMTFHEARGLCRPCYGHARYAGTLIDVERPSRSRDEVMAEWDLLRREGHTKKQAAARLGMTFAAFETAYYRARRDGDPRAVVTGSRARAA